LPNQLSKTSISTPAFCAPATGGVLYSVGQIGSDDLVAFNDYALANQPSGLISEPLGARAIPREEFPEGRGSLASSGTVTLDQLGNIQSAAPLTPTTRYLQHGRSVDDLPQRDRAAAAHRRSLFRHRRAKARSRIRRSARQCQGRADPELFEDAPQQLDPGRQREAVPIDRLAQQLISAASSGSSRSSVVIVLFIWCCGLAGG
jgi:hypothetical protein